MTDEFSGAEFTASIFNFCGNIRKFSIMKTVKYIIVKEIWP
jgi:hypothetical protein